MRKLTFLFLILIVLSVASPVYAQGGGAPAGNWSVPIGVGLGMGLAAGLAGLGQGKVAGAVAEALARQAEKSRSFMQTLVPFGDSSALAREVVELLRDEPRRHAMRKKAYMLGRRTESHEIGATPIGPR